MKIEAVCLIKDRGAGRRHWSVQRNRRVSVVVVVIQDANDDQPLSLILIDVDHFKAINDRFGHPVGDACLRRIATAIDLVAASFGALSARIGGEEFAILLGGVGSDEAQHCAHAINETVAALQWGAQHSGIDRLTVSAGVCTVFAPIAPERLEAAADRTLYGAKRQGRNRVETAMLQAGPQQLSA